MDGKRRRLHDAGAGRPVPPPSKRRRDGGNHDSRASKEQEDGRISSASPVAQLSCARIRPYVRASRPKAEKTEVSAGDNAHVMIKKHNADKRISCNGGGRAAEAQAPRPTDASTQVRAGAVAAAHDMIKKQKAGQGTSCTSTKPAAQASRPNEAIKPSSGVTRKQQESGERVQAVATASIPHPQLAHPVPPSKPKDPFEADNAFRAAIAKARQALVRRRREAARRERDKMVQTVYFNDPNLTLENVLKAQALIGSC
ncbi:hypothetical protein ZWY2020_024446 [Hordeum vulgare]|nr:hypothetical protein ZWY2020_024446 [Hordeum vulgare]